MGSFFVNENCGYRFKDTQSEILKKYIPKDTTKSFREVQMELTDAKNLR